MDFVIKLLWELLYGLFWGAVFLIVSAVLLPDHIFRKLLKKIKPDLVSKDGFMRRLRVIFDYLFNNKEVVLKGEFGGSAEPLLTELANLMREKRLLESNLFFLDLLQNLSSVLSFSVLQSGYDNSALRGIINKSMEYLQYYSNKLSATPSSQNIKEQVDFAAVRLQKQIEDIEDYLQSDRGKEKVQMLGDMMRRDIEHFDSYMKGEYESTKANLIKTNQLLADKFLVFMGDSD